MGGVPVRVHVWNWRGQPTGKAKYHWTTTLTVSVHIVHRSLAEAQCHLYDQGVAAPMASNDWPNVNTTGVADSGSGSVKLHFGGQVRRCQSGR